MITTKFYLDIRSKKKDGTYPIKINITRNRKAFFINTGFSSTKERWEGNQFSNNEPNFRPKNVRLRDMMNKVEKVIFDLGESCKENSTTDKQLKNLIESKLFGQDSSGMTFIECMDMFLETKIKPNTRNIYIDTSGKNGKLDPLKTDEGDHLKFLLQKSVKLFIGNGV